MSDKALREKFWDYCRKNLAEVLTWPEWMRGGTMKSKAECGETLVSDVVCTRPAGHGGTHWAKGLCSDSVQGNSEALREQYRVEPSSKNQPYKFAVLDREDKAVAFSTTREKAQHCCDQMNERGYIEDPD